MTNTNEISTNNLDRYKKTLKPAENTINSNHNYIFKNFANLKSKLANIWIQVDKPQTSVGSIKLIQKIINKYFIKPNDVEILVNWVLTNDILGYMKKIQKDILKINDDGIFGPVTRWGIFKYCQSQNDSQAKPAQTSDEDRFLPNKDITDTDAILPDSDDPGLSSLWHDNLNLLEIQTSIKSIPKQIDTQFLYPNSITISQYADIVSNKIRWHWDCGKKVREFMQSLNRIWYITLPIDLAKDANRYRGRWWKAMYLGRMVIAYTKKWMPKNWTDTKVEWLDFSKDWNDSGIILQKLSNSSATMWVLVMEKSIKSWSQSGHIVFWARVWAEILVYDTDMKNYQSTADKKLPNWLKAFTLQTYINQYSRHYKITAAMWLPLSKPLLNRFQKNWLYCRDSTNNIYNISKWWASVVTNKTNIFPKIDDIWVYGNNNMYILSSSGWIASIFRYQIIGTNQNTLKEPLNYPFDNSSFANIPTKLAVDWSFLFWNIKDKSIYQVRRDTKANLNIRQVSTKWNIDEIAWGLSTWVQIFSFANSANVYIRDPIGKSITTYRSNPIKSNDWNQYTYSLTYLFRLNIQIWNEQISDIAISDWLKPEAYILKSDWIYNIPLYQFLETYINKQNTQT